MPFGRSLRLLLLALPVLLGLAAGADRMPPVDAAAVSTIGTPRERLPVPVHDEATCAFCQAAVFAPLRRRQPPAPVRHGARSGATSPRSSGPHFTARPPTPLPSPTSTPNV